MDYKLAKKLKNSGFPQGERKEGNYISSSGIVRQIAIIPMVETEQAYYSPTLLELIEACGEDFGALTTTLLIMSKSKKDKNKIGKICNCVAVKHDAKCNIPECCPSEAGGGYSPIEAVANLWLGINKK